MRHQVTVTPPACALRTSAPDRGLTVEGLPARAALFVSDVSRCGSKTRRQVNVLRSLPGFLAIAEKWRNGVVILPSAV
jgi:hypothetical protein